VYYANIHLCVHCVFRCVLYTMLQADVSATVIAVLIADREVANSFIQDLKDLALDLLDGVETVKDIGIKVCRSSTPCSLHSAP
jgi:hypothetical protein